MIYVLNEQLMNGTVTMQVITTLIHADSGAEAYEKLKKFKNWKDAEDIQEDDEAVTYRIGMGCWGRLSMKPSEVL